MAAKRKANLLYDLNELPPRIRETIRGLPSLGTFLLAAPTEYRPNADMPFAWLVLTSRQLVLCNTHRTRGIYAAHQFSEINEVRAESANRVLRILLNDPGLGDLVIPLHPELTAEHVGIIVHSVQPAKT
jgi:hypothetical protein